MSRRGLTILEAVVAVGLLGTLLVGCLQLLAATAAMRRASDERQFAAMELANVMESVAARPWAELTSAAVASDDISPEVAGRLPGAELKIDVAAPSGETNAKKITATLRWRPSAAQPPAEVGLTTWKYKTTP